MAIIKKAAAVAAIAATCLITSGVQANASTVAKPAQPNHSGSSTYNYPGGDRLQADVWIDNTADSNGCGNWTTSAKLLGTNPSNAAWIKNTAAFHANGVGASISGVGLTGNGTDLSESWTNNNAWESDLAGNLCANWLTWYVGASSTAISYVPQYGAARSATAAV